MPSRLVRAAKVQGHTREGRAGGGVCPGVRHGDAWHRGRNRAQMGSIVMPRARRTWAAHPERHYMVKAMRATTSQTVTANKPRLGDIGRTISLDSQTFRMMPVMGRAKRQALSTPSTGEPARASFPVLILTVPNNPIRHSCTRSDYNCGATLICAGMCVHVFSIEFACLRGRWSAPLCKISF